MTTALVLSALFMGVAIGFWRGHDHGRDKGFVAGYEVGRSIGLILGKPKRNIKGRFTK